MDEPIKLDSYSRNETPLIWLGDTEFGSTIYDDWVEAPMGEHDPFLMSLIILLTIGKAIRSPKLMQLSAEVVPRGISRAPWYKRCLHCSGCTTLLFCKDDSHAPG